MAQEQLWIPIEEGKLECIHYSCEGAPLILFCHGFPGDYKHYDLAESLQSSGFGVVVLKYRGVDGSSGFFNFRNAIDDVRQAVRYLDSHNLAARGMGIFGYSAGAYFGINLAVEMPVIKSVCVLSPLVDLPRTARLKFENIYDLMVEAPKKIRVKGVHDLVASFAEIWKDYNVIEQACKLRDTPLLIIEGDSTEHGDPAQARMLYDAAKEPKQFHNLEGAGHFFEATEHRQQIGMVMDAFFKRTLMQGNTHV